MIIDYNPYLTCSDPYAHRSVMSAIVKVESGGNPWAININKLGVRLLAQPKTKEEAIKWVDWFNDRGYNIDVGIAQVNIKNIKRMGYNPTDFLDPCLNLKVASQILLGNYKSSSKLTNNTNDAVKLAISAYNTGNFRSGFANGYVGKVVNKYNGVTNQQLASNDIPPLSSYNTTPQASNNSQPSRGNKKNQNYNQNNNNNYSMKVNLWQRYDAPPEKVTQ